MSNKRQLRSLWGAVVLVAALAALLPAAAQADYEQVPEHFGVGGESEQLENAYGVAVNENGAGGVEPGSLYVVGGNERVLRYAPGAEGEAPAFREAWGWGVRQGASEEAYERCGPAVEEEGGEAAHCRPHQGNVNGGHGGPELGHFEGLLAVAVDQANGYVYVRNEVYWGTREHHLIEVFTAMGTPVGEGFGDAGDKSSSPAESIAEGSDKLHRVFGSEAGIAVDESGTVYLNDSDFVASGIENPVTRIMSFRPESPGDYEHYVYAGTEHDISVSAKSGVDFSKVALVPGGGLVAGNRELIREYRIGGGNTPICTASVTGQLYGMAGNSVTGEVFYFTYTDRSIHRLGPCDEATGKFTELQAPVKPAPETKSINTLAVDASLAWSPARPAGTLYAVDPNNHGSQYGIGDIFAPAKVTPPEVLSESVANTTTGSTTLRARIDPRGHATAYYFQYLSEAEYLLNGESFEGPQVPAQAPASPGTIPSGAAATAAAAISGLSPDTAYVFRVVASSACNGAGEEACVTVGEAHAFATYAPSPAVPPDGRAYELVSPARKNGGEVYPADPSVNSCGGPACKPPGGAIVSVFPEQSAPGGDAVSYMGNAFSETEGAAVFNSYISRRGPEGWETTPMSPSLLATGHGEDLAFDRGLSTGTVLQTSPQLPAFPVAPVGYANVYLQSATEPGALRPLVASTPPHRAQGSFSITYDGAPAADFSRQYFAANDTLTGAVAGIAPLPPEINSTEKDLYEWHDGRLAMVNVLPGNAAVASGATFASASPDTNGVSSEGRRVFWEAGGHLYVREDGQVTREVTQPGSFLAASPDGLRVLLTSGCLYDLATEGCTDLSAGQGGFQGIAGSSEDLSRIYFVDTAVLAAAGSNERGEEPQVGENNLYLYEEGASPRFITTLAASDGVGGTQGQGLADWLPAPSKRTAEASPSGRLLAFASTLSLTGYDNIGPCATLFNSETRYETVSVPCTEVFLYDAATGSLTCPSCNPTGEAPLGNSTLRRIAGERAWQPQPRYLTDAGRLYFDSQDRLSPRDVNGAVEDVYEYEPAGIGTCGRAGGCVALISPGTGSVDSNLLAVDESGGNVFFTSRERLVSQDTDELIDLYDAREGGGFPSESEAQRAECQGESCQPIAQAPNDPTPSSSAFHGAGNVKEAGAKKPAGCRKGKVKKKGKCVRKHVKHHKRRKHHRRANRGRRNHR